MACVTRKNFILIIPLILILIANVAFAGENIGAGDGVKRTRLGKESLILRDMPTSPQWCGSKALLFQEVDKGFDLFHIETKQWLRISDDENDWPLSCSPDGNLIAYYRHIVRPIERGSKDWQVGLPLIKNVSDVYIYEVSTGERHRVMESDGMGSLLISPDGARVFLGADYRYPPKNPIPGMEAVWFNNPLWEGNAVWLPDSSGVVKLEYHARTKTTGIAVEFFYEGGWAGHFTLPKYGSNWDSLNVDGENRIYFITSDDLIPSSDMNSVLYRCAIGVRGLSCEKVFEADELGPYEILPGGDILLQKDYADECIYRLPSGGTGEDLECVIDAEYEDRIYRRVHLIGLSPDRKKFLFDRSNWVKEDLFMVELGSE